MWKPSALLVLALLSLHAYASSCMDVCVINGGTAQCTEGNLAYEIADYKRWIMEGEDLSDIVSNITSGKNPMKFYGGDEVSPRYAKCVLEAAGYKFPQQRQPPGQASNPSVIPANQYLRFSGKPKNKLIDEYQARSDSSPDGAGQVYEASADLGSDMINWKRPVTCLKVEAVDGYQSLVNTCNTPINWGYCIVNQTRLANRCAARESRFSRSGETYIQGTGQIAVGETYRIQELKGSDKYLFVVGCHGSYPLIEAMSSKNITPSTKATSSCWEFAR